MPDHSRLLKLASAAARSDVHALADRVSAICVHITADIDHPGTPAALRVLVRNLRQLPIGLSVEACGTDSAPALLEDLVTLCRGIDPGRPLVVGDRPPTALAVHLGTSPGPGTFLAAVPDGHGARLRIEGDAFPADLAPASGLGSVLTAALVTAELFKEITGLSPVSRSETKSFDFCPVTFTSQPGRHHNPTLVLERIALLGCGAIGTAIALILSLLKTSGALAVVDPEPFDDPNVITYSLGFNENAAAKTAKTKLVAAALPSLDVTPLDIDVQTYIERIDEGALSMPKVILNGLDTIEARHDAARLHADLTIDGSTGGDTGTTVGLRVAQHDGPCLRCFYPRAPETPTLADRTGLPPDLIRDGDAVLDDELLAVVDPAHRFALEHLRGERICALARLLTQDGDFRLSASFVAQLAGCLVVGALIVQGQNIERPHSQEVEFDALFGWNTDAAQAREPTPTCVCQTDQPLIAEVRRHRLGA